MKGFSELVKIVSIFLGSFIIVLGIQMGFELFSVPFQENVTYRYQIITLINLFWYISMATGFYVAIAPKLNEEFQTFTKYSKRIRRVFIVRGLLLMYAVQIGITIILDLLNMFEVSNNQMAILELAGVGPLTQISLVLFSVFLAPFTEEILFRRVLFKWLEAKSSHILAIILASILFGFIHGLTELDNPIVLLPYIGVGVVLQIFYIRSKTLMVPVAMHALFNFIGVTVILITTYFPSLLA